MAEFLKPGTRVKAYVVSELLGAGGEGTAYRARDKRGRSVVVKQHKFSASDPSRALDLERVKRLERLIGERCDQVAEILDVFESGDLMYVAMEHVDGESLETVLSREVRIDPERFRDIASDVLAGLAWLHGNGLIHRDIKPANIIVRTLAGHAQAKLIDLDIGLHLDLPRLTIKGMGVATYQYAPPEVIRGKGSPIDGRADLYSFGVTAFEMLSGQPAFPDSDFETMIARVCSPDRPSLRSCVPEASEALDAFLQRLMSVRPADRPASAEAAWLELQHILEGPVKDIEPAAVVSVSVPPAPVAPVEKKRPESGRKIPTPSAPSIARLRIASGDRTGVVIGVPREGVALGRNHLNPDDRSISRFHVRAVGKKFGVVLHDLGSTNGLIHKGRRRRKVLLCRGEEVHIGETVVVCD